MSVFYLEIRFSTAGPAACSPARSEFEQSREAAFGMAQSGGGVSRENHMESRYTRGVGRFLPAKRNRGYDGMSSAHLPWPVIVWG